ncbi:uncharacterized protein LOC131613262 [Vicia villosa]|uniref:uncharacterized protein LOC131613262 n=1 Tax=Vicia villosa TaxID=3911 RepID=UPI00273B9460|nr:uncharacterized protein LOC131613262 [Vicia villosa]
MIWLCETAETPNQQNISDQTLNAIGHSKKRRDSVLNNLPSGTRFSKAITSSFLSLIPKTSNLLSLDDYRPICLVGCMYKVVDKSLAGRLKCVLDSIISPCQNAFMPGRQLLDGVLVANEVVDYRIGFGRRWMGWMEMLVFNSSMSVLFNGSSTKEFGVFKGLRKGDPLSPFLYVLVAEGLSGLVMKSIEIGKFGSFCIKSSCWVDILQFADDTLLVGEGTWKHVKAIKGVLRAFEIVLGLGTEEKRKIHWVIWKNVTLPFDKGGIGVKNIAVFNQALLTKWIWRILQGHDSLWLRVLKSRYGDLSSLVYGKFGSKSPSFSSISSHFSLWWRDVIKIGRSSFRDPIVEGCRFVVHNGYNTHFWEANWWGGNILKDVFPDLYEASSLKGVLVAIMGGWLEGRWRWGDFGVSIAMEADRGLSEGILRLKEVLSDFGEVGEGRDVVSWNFNSDGFFGWHLVPLFWEKILCRIGLQTKNRNHSFFGCRVVKAIWKEIALWVGKEGGMEDGCLLNFMD